MRIRLEPGDEIVMGCADDCNEADHIGVVRWVNDFGAHVQIYGGPYDGDQAFIPYEDFP